MAKEIWINESTGERKTFTNEETSFMLRTTDGCSWKVGLNASEYTMLITAAESMTKDGYFWVSKAARMRISKVTGLSERTIFDSLKSLSDKNIIVKVGAGEYLMNPEVAFKFPVRYMGEKIAEYYSIKNKGDGKSDEMYQL